MALMASNTMVKVKAEIMLTDSFQLSIFTFIIQSRICSEKEGKGPLFNLGKRN